VRSLIADLGDAYCVSLRRTRIGHFSVANADSSHLIALDEALAFIPGVRLDGDRARQASHGVAVLGDAEGVVRLTDEDGLIALAEPDGADPSSLRVLVGFRG
jgi:tRNA pseudouridine55 synthase